MWNLLDEGRGLKVRRIRGCEDEQDEEMRMVRG
jgi:hypothetical protein